MKRHRLKIVLGVILLFITISVISAIADFKTNRGWSNEPEATNRPVAVSDLVGTWRYFTTDQKTTIDITLHADGSFSQEVTPPTGQKLQASGKWDLQRNLILMESPLMLWDNSWRPGTAVFMVIDSQKKPGTLAVFGGTFNDPDVYSELIRVP
jgi:hypothetical protein